MLDFNVACGKIFGTNSVPCDLLALKSSGWPVGRAIWFTFTIGAYTRRREANRMALRAFRRRPRSEASQFRAKSTKPRQHEPPLHCVRLSSKICF